MNKTAFRTAIYLGISALIAVMVPLRGDLASAQTLPAVNQGVGSNTSRNWAGYIATNGSYTGIGASWTVPTATSNGVSADATWVGIGGVNSNDLIQAGTQAVDEGNGSTQYVAWYEMLPASMVQVPLTVSPGDGMTVSLAESSANMWTITIRDDTKGQSYTTSVPYSSSLSSAEWIEEMPTLAAGNELIPLDDFGSVQWSGGYAVDSGSTLDIAQSGVQPITMTSAAGQPLAVPSGLDATGAGFSITRTAAAVSESTIPSSYVVTVTRTGGSGWHRTSVGVSGFRGHFTPMVRPYRGAAFRQSRVRMGIRQGSSF